MFSEFGANVLNVEWMVSKDGKAIENSGRQFQELQINIRK